MSPAGRRRALDLGFAQEQSPLTFVAISHPDQARDPKIQKKIHHHAMRYVGRSKRRKPRVTVISLEVAAPTAAASCLAGPSIPPLATTQLCHAPSVSGIATADNDLRTLELLHFACHGRDRFYRPFQSLFVRMAMFDKAACNLVLANAAVFLHRLWQPSTAVFEADLESAKYYSKSLNDLSSRLCDPIESCGEGVFAAVVGFLCHDANVGNWERWRLHMAGLRKLAALRGGMQGLGNSIPHLAWWMGLIGAAVLDLRPTIPMPDDLDCWARTASTWNFLTNAPPNVQGEAVDASILTNIMSMMSMMSSVADIVNLHSQDPYFWRRDIEAIGLIGPAIHHILSIPRLGEQQSSSELGQFQEVIRLTCLIILAKLKALFSYQASEIHILVANLVLLICEANGRWAHFNPELSVWALVTGILIYPDEHKPVMVLEAHEHLSTAGLENIEQAIKLTKSLVWIEALEEGKAIDWTEGANI